MKRIKQFLSSSFAKPLLLALFIRFLLMPFLFHPDLKSHHFHFYFLSQGVTDIYQYLTNNIDSLPYTDTFNYPPLVYFLFGGVQSILKPFLGSGFVSWLFDWGPDRFAAIDLYRYLFVLKVPYLILDIAAAFLLTKFFKNQTDKKKVFFLWLFNPIVLYAIYGLSSFDILPSFLVLYSVFLSLKKRKNLSALVLGLAAAFKTYPLLLLPFLAVLGTRDIRGRIKILVLGIAPYLLSLLPFLSSAAFRQSALLSGLSQRLFLTAIPIGFGENLILFVLGLTFLFFMSLKSSLRDNSKEKIIAFFSSVLLLIFALGHYHPQWIVWVLPFLTILLVKKPSFLFPEIVFYLCFLAVVFLFNDRAQVFGLFAPLNAELLEVPSLFELLRDKNIIDPFLIQSLFHSLLAGTSFWLILQSLREKNE